MPVVFKNPGEADPRALTTFGVNVKNSPAAFGRFGTGFCFAIAVLLRMKQQVLVIAGKNTYTFFTQAEEIRGKEFGLVHMRVSGADGPKEAPLGFTTDLGKHWELWMAYRELYCNAKDEDGDSTWLDEYPSEEEGFTYVVVDGEEFAQIHNDRDRFILPVERLEPLFVIPGEVEVYPGTSHSAYYRSIRVGDIPNGPSRYTYNVLGHLWLTEDRTMGWPDQFIQYMGKAAMLSDNEDYLKDILLTVDEDGNDRKGAETFISFEGKTLAGKILKVAKEVIETTKGRINDTIMSSYREYERENLLLARLDLTGEQSTILVNAYNIVGRTPFKPGDFQIGVVADVGAGKHVYRKDRTILLHVDLLDDPLKLRLTLLQELMDAAGHDLDTQEGREWLLDQYIQLHQPEPVNEVAVHYDDPPSQHIEFHTTMDMRSGAMTAAAVLVDDPPEVLDYVLEGTWSGYTSKQEGVKHRVLVSEAFAAKAEGLTIQFTDATTLTLRARKVQPGETVHCIHGYDSLIQEAIDSGETFYIIKPK